MKYEPVGFRKGGAGNMKLDGVQGRMATLEDTIRGIEDRNDENKLNKMEIKKKL